MTPEELATFKEYVREDKTWINDAYYRLREIPEGYEFAKLEMDACGASIVSPKITLQLDKGQWQAISLTDLSVSPTVFIELSDDTSQVLETKLKKLMRDCQTSYQKI